ncbi:MAG: zinc-binding alcohol dehydrogenase family protein [Hyphomicrobiales bacterium]
MSVNPVDTKVRRPKDKTESPARVLGWDAAGVVVACGFDCRLFRPGDEVYGAGDITRAGSNAEFQLVDERIVGRKPGNLNFIEAAALPLTTITAWEALFDRMGFSEEPSERNRSASLLIIGGAGGVGSIATQIGKRLAGVGKVITTASRRESVAWCERMGADLSIDHSKPLKAQLLALGIEFVDAILCCAPTDQYFDQMADIVRPQGVICSIVEATAGAPLPMNKLQSKSVSFAWEFMFTRSMFTTPDMEEQHRLLNRVAAAIESGRIETTLTRIVGPLTAENLRFAHAEIETGRAIGKLVLVGMGGDGR